MTSVRAGSGLRRYLAATASFGLASKAIWEDEGYFVTLKDGRVIFIKGPSQGAGFVLPGPDEESRPIWERTRWSRTEWLRVLCGAGTPFALSENEMEYVFYWLRNVPDEHLSSLNGIYVYRKDRRERDDYYIPLDDDGYLLYDKTDGNQGTCIGLYTSDFKRGEFHHGTIELTHDQDFDQSTLLHELGHHVHKLNPKVAQIVDHVYSNVMRAAEDSLSDEESERRFEERLRFAGLRDYSLTNTRELFADLYMVYHIGIDSAQADKFLSDFGGIGTEFKDAFRQVFP